MINTQIEKNSGTKVFRSLVFAGMILLGIAASLQRVEAQDVIKDEDVVAVADEMPNFPGGTKALIDNVYSKIEYPADAVAKKVEGRVIVRFIVTKSGEAVQPSISKGLYPSIDKEVLRVVKNLPKFSPGKLKGQPVNVWYAIPITFKIN